MIATPVILLYARKFLGDLVVAVASGALLSLAAVSKLAGMEMLREAAQDFSIDRPKRVTHRGVNARP